MLGTYERPRAAVAKANVELNDVVEICGHGLGPHDLGRFAALGSGTGILEHQGRKSQGKTLGRFPVDDRHGGRLRVVVLGVEAEMELELEVEGDSPWRVQGSEYVCLIVSCRCWRWAFYPVSIATSGNRD